MYGSSTFNLTVSVLEGLNYDKFIFKQMKKFVERVELKMRQSLGLMFQIRDFFEMNGNPEVPFK